MNSWFWIIGVPVPSERENWYIPGVWTDGVVQKTSVTDVVVGPMVAGFSIEISPNLKEHWSGAKRSLFFERKTLGRESTKTENVLLPSSKSLLKSIGWAALM